MNTIDQLYLDKGINYNEYRTLANNLIDQGKVTGIQQSEELTAYGKLNMARMNRLDKTLELLPECIQLLSTIQEPQTWLILTESWCGDAAQIVPVLAAMANVNENITLKILLRDENLPLMDQYLTNGKSRSIPKLIAINQQRNELFNWGPRPNELQVIMTQLQQQQTPMETIKETIHKWYAQNKSIAIQEEIMACLSK